MSESDLETSCPWGPHVTHLNVHIMTGDEKMWFARQVNQNRVAVSKLAKRFNLKYKQVYIWARRAKDGTNLKTKGGPEEVLDRVSKMAMEKFCLRNKTATALEIRTELTMQYNLSLRRKPDYIQYSDDNEDETQFSMARNTLGRYLSFYRRQCLHHWDTPPECS